MTDPLRIALERRQVLADEIERLTAFIRSGEHLMRDLSLADVDVNAKSASKEADWAIGGRRNADNVISWSEFSARARGGRTALRSRSDCGSS